MEEFVLDGAGLAWCKMSVKISEQIMFRLKENQNPTELNDIMFCKKFIGLFYKLFNTLVCIIIQKKFRHLAKNLLLLVFKLLMR